MFDRFLSRFIMIQMRRFIVVMMRRVWLHMKLHMRIIIKMMIRWRVMSMVNIMMNFQFMMMKSILNGLMMREWMMLFKVRRQRINWERKMVIDDVVIMRRHQNTSKLSSRSMRMRMKVWRRQRRWEISKTKIWHWR